jgi:hypothetical protein
VGRFTREKRTLSYYELNSEVVEPQSRSGREAEEAGNNTSAEYYCPVGCNSMYYSFVNILFSCAVGRLNRKLQRQDNE